MKQIFTAFGAGSLLLLVGGGFAPQEPAAPMKPTPPRMNVIITPAIPVPKRLAPNTLQRFPIVVDEKNPANYPITVAEGNAARYPIRIITPEGYSPVPSAVAPQLAAPPVLRVPTPAPPRQTPSGPKRTPRR